MGIGHFALIPIPDVLVVGAGPAGSIAALVLARAGVRVRLVDRESFPRDKLCGDTLNPGAAALLGRFGLAEAVGARAAAITGMLVSGPGGAAVAADYPDGMQGLAILRSSLDATLLEAAIAAGADFTPGVHVTGPSVAADGATVAGVRVGRTKAESMCRARIVVAADGRHSTLAFSMGLARFAAAPKRWAFGAYYAGVEQLTTRGEMHIQPRGYTGVAPLPGGLANVCVVCDRHDLHAFRHARPEEVVASALARHPALRDRFRRAHRVGPVSVLGPLAVDAVAAGCPGLLLAGDAAGFVDPMTGDGLRFAIRGGELAAVAAIAELETGQPAHARLDAARRREFGAKWRLNRALRRLVGSPRGVATAAALSAHWPAPVRLLIEAAADLHLARELARSA
ncbi:MAG: hypothetical protein A3H29_19170 [Acidobacteria bacterium RIFCSPLOWO2_02_FULL_67_21]|nr:MAG: hypothetical protein A3H29_19170 [Acidobacteria bacterium RIFCSPLOWO2_02_FULL_67_21]